MDRRLNPWCIGLLAAALAAPAARAAGAPAYGLRVSADTAARLPATSATDHGGFVWVTLDDAQYAALLASGQEFSDGADYTLKLGQQSFDPLLLPQPRVASVPGRAAPNLHLVQFTGPSKEAWLDDLRAAGLDVVQYIPPFTYVVWGSSTQRDAVRNHARVRWTGDFAPEYRVLPQFRGRTAGRAAARAVVYRGADVDTVRQQLTAAGAAITQLENMDQRFAVVTFDIDVARLADVAAIPGVYTAKFVPTDGGLRGELTDQICVNHVDAGNIAFPGYPAWLSSVGLSGAGVIIANVDSGIAEVHPDLINRMLPCVGSTCGGATSSLHGTHTAGIMAADGSSGVLDGNGFLRGLGMAPGAHLVEQLYSPTFQQADGMLTLMRQSYQNGAIVSGNSWGPSDSARGYDDDTMQVDIGVRDADSTTLGHQSLIYVLSIMNGNGGVSEQGSPDEAKNIFTIGSTRAQTSSGVPLAVINDISANSAHGPALDGRKIPHMVAPGCYVDSTAAPGGYTANQCGTSMASPHVSGAIALFIEYYRSLPETTGDPSPALAKAAFIAVAHDLAGRFDADGGVLGHPFDSKQGWGRLDAEAVLDPAHDVRYFDNPVVFDQTGQEWNTTITADDPLQPIRLMLVWTDAPGHGLGGNTPAWNNDLDLVVESGANTYLGNVFGSDGYSTTGGTRDAMNNTEGVFVLAPGSGEINVRVLATSVNSDAIPDVGDSTDQDFSLVCYNCRRPAGFALHAEITEVDVCAGAEAEYTIQVAQVSAPADPVTLSALGLPGAASGNFSTNPVVPTGYTVLTVGDTAGLNEGTYAFDVEGASSNGTLTLPLSLGIFTTVADAVPLLSPAPGATGLPRLPTLTWDAVATAQSYTVEVADDPAFTQITFSASTPATSATLMPMLAHETQYFWRVLATNPCGASLESEVRSFVTTPPVLLIDGDDNAPDVRSAYTAALDELGVYFDVWDTNQGASEPAFSDLEYYTQVVWFTGDLFGVVEPGLAGPSPAAEAALAAFLDNGGCFFITSQDYHHNRGLTAFMTDYLGVASVTEDQFQSSATGTAAPFAGFGPVTLSFPFTNFSDALVPGPGAAASMVGDVGTLGLSHDTGVYRAAYWVFPLEAVPTAQHRATLMNRLVHWCGAVPPVPGDYDRDGDVDPADFLHWADCMTGPVAGPAADACTAFDFDGDTHVDLQDFAILQNLLDGDA